MRLWRKAVVRIPVAAVLRLDDGERFAAEALLERARQKATFDITTARIARDMATPALGKGPPPVSRARL